MNESKQDICYLSGDIITSDNKTDEHIIPNALNGHLTSNKVLTSDSNLSLGKTIDSKFESIFDIFTSQMGFRRDRGRNRNFTVTDIITNEKYVLSDSKISPVTPFYDKDNSIIYAKDKKKYNQIYKKIKSGELNNIGFIDDRTGHYFYRFDISNKEFKQGVAKIAAGFATMNGVKRESLDCVLDAQNKKILEKPHVLPFIALSDLEKKVESKINESSIFPFHSLIVHGSRDSGLLYCYVELFSTFQYIVILSYDYSGDDFYNDYFHSLNRDEVFDFQDYTHELKKILPSFDCLKYREIDEDYISKISYITKFNYQEFKRYGHLKFNALMKYANKKVHLNKINK